MQHHVLHLLIMLTLIYNICLPIWKVSKSYSQSTSSIQTIIWLSISMNSSFCLGQYTRGGCSHLNGWLEHCRGCHTTTKLVSCQVHLWILVLIICLGELEVTVAYAFARASNLRAILFKSGCPEVIKHTEIIFHKLVDPQLRDSLQTDIWSFEQMGADDEEYSEVD